MYISLTLHFEGTDFFNRICTHFSTTRYIDQLKLDRSAGKWNLVVPCDTDFRVHVNSTFVLIADARGPPV
jgi:hypothetical protein